MTPPVQRLSMDAATALARRRSFERLLRCALSERLLDANPPDPGDDRRPARASVETPAGAIRLKCRPPFVGWRHGEIERVTISPPGSRLARRIEDPLDLLEILRGLHPEGRWDRLCEEIENSITNEALSIATRSERNGAIAEAARIRGCATLIDWVRASVPEAEWSVFLEQWSAVGHPHHPCAKTRIGFTAKDSIRYAPEFGAGIDVSWLAVRRDRLVLETASSDLDPWAFLARHFPAAIKRWRLGLGALGAAPEDYLPLPVHPWQWREIVTSRFADEIARGEIIRPEGAETPCLATLSLRTLTPTEPAGAPWLKLPLSIQVTSSRRELVPGVVAAGPWMTRRIEGILARDETLRGALAILGEPVGLRFLSADPEDGRAGMLSALLRRPVSHVLRPGEIAIPVAALFVPSPVTGKPLFIELAEATNGNTLSAFADYCRLALTAFLRLSLLFGIALEAHQQNTLLVVDEHDALRRIVARDFGARVLASADPSDPVPAAAREMEVPDRGALRELVSHAVFESHVRELVALLARQGAIRPEGCWRVVRTVIDEVFAGLGHEIDIGTANAERGALLGRPWRAKSLLRMRVAEHPGDSFVDTENPLARAG
ncbi:IucA/IucC family siderophore biosynthesis protein [Inquilinus sp. Marseille-Q2685]|uniref:IucA/IucC family protein n=1 Tax=Inquilinus sp. Marseille-Q2685 TaxID=2866581 RepID=UPI001CE3C398|nr:IucA/IucC family protein [Inquilinus sp. Marseille-Q2685]